MPSVKSQQAHFLSCVFLFFRNAEQAEEGETFPISWEFTVRLHDTLYSTLVKLTWLGDLEGDTVRASGGRDLPR